MSAAAADRRSHRLFVEADMGEPVAIELAGGTALVVSVRCPGKDDPNEDAAAALPAGPGRGALAVADGVGGQAAGALAASEAVGALSDALADPRRVANGLRDGILDGFELANQRIMAMSQRAATTLTVAEIDGGSVRPYHVGDSGLLLIGQRGRVKHELMPHSPVGRAVEAGLLDEHEALHHEERHLVSNAVGGSDMHIEVGPRLTVARHDTLLLASDGLFDNLSVDEIVAAIRCGPLLAGVHALLALARARMTEPAAGQPSKPDDLTLVAWRPHGPVARPGGAA